MSRDEETMLKASYPYAWVANCWKYLRIKIPLQFSKLAKVNQEDLNELVNHTLRSWNNNVLSWLKHIQIVKTVFPKFLFMFRALPLFLT